MSTTTKPEIIRNFEALWDANDVAAYLKVSKTWVYQRVEAGLIPYHRIGGLVRFEPDAIREFACRPATTKRS
jgi:excisionase family DNA binding protein